MLSIAGLALAARLLAAWLFDNVQVSDARVYDQLARTLLTTGRYEWGGHLSAWWPVGYPSFLAGVYYVFGASPLSGQVANAALGALTVMLTYALVRPVSETAAPLAGLGMAVFPSHVWAVNLLTTETLCTMLWLSAMVALWPPASRQRALVGGLCLGTATLVRPTLLLFPVVWAVGLWYVGRKWRETSGTIVLATLAMGLVIAPWAYRNQNVLGAPVLVSTNGGFNLWIGNNPLASGNYLLTTGEHSFHYAQSDPAVDRTVGEVEQDARYRARALAWIGANPWHAIELIPRKLRYLWATDNDTASWLLAGIGAPRNGIAYVAVHAVTLAAYLTVAALALRTLCCLPLGMGVLWLTPVVLVTVVHMVFFADDRFHLTVMPSIVALAALGADPGYRSPTARSPWPWAGVRNTRPLCGLRFPDRLLNWRREDQRPTGAPSRRRAPPGPT